jgi:hypothetical protein
VPDAARQLLTQDADEAAQIIVVPGHRMRREPIRFGQSSGQVQVQVHIAGQRQCRQQQATQGHEESGMNGVSTRSLVSRREVVDGVADAGETFKVGDVVH